MGKKMDMATPAMPPKDGGEEDYEAKHAYETIAQAHAHMADEGMMERVRSVSGRKMKAAVGLNDTLTPKKKKLQINSLADVKAAGKAMRERGSK